MLPTMRRFSAQWVSGLRLIRLISTATTATFSARAGVAVIASARPIPTTVETVRPDPTTAPVVDATPTPAPARQQPTLETVTPAPAAAPEPAPRRVISREGLVIISRSIQAPTPYALENSETRRTINYLHSEEETIKLKSFAGRKVIITGEELIDQRWRNTPIIEVETIRLVP